MHDDRQHRVGALLVSVMVLGPERQLLARITSYDRLDAQSELATITGGAETVGEELLAHVRAWLDNVTR